MYRAHQLIEVYLTHLKAISGRSLNQVRIALDCANGAVYELAPRLFSELGATVTAINNDPDGTNINLDSGSLHPQALQALVVEERAHLGLAFDGDGDRAMLVDEKGRLVDGDHILAICGLDLARKNRLPGNAVAATVMSNMGLEAALARENVRLVRTQVGDRYVSDEMRKSGIILGGEKSGHVIFSEHSTTGDGMVTALQVLGIMLESGKSLSELAAQMPEYPQLLVSVPVKDKLDWRQVPEIASAIECAEKRLEGRGRIFVRASGTESLIRVMAEGPDQVELEEIVEEVCGVIKGRLG